MYKYIKLNNTYYNCNLNPFRLMYLLLFKTKPLGYVYNINNLKITISVLRKALKTVIDFIAYKFGKREFDRIISCSFYGDLLLKVRNGIKIFDVTNKQVTKVFNKEEPKDLVVREIERIITVAEYSFTPDVFGIDSSNKYYQEEYINGNRIDFNIGWAGWLCNIDTFVIPIIEKLILIKVELVNVNEYLAKKKKAAFEKLHKCDFISRYQINIIKEFVTYYIKDIEKEGSTFFHLAFSHGDFSQKHILLESDGKVKVIDWETLGMRSTLFDFYNCFFQKYRKSLNKEVEHTKYIHYYLGELQQRLSQNEDPNVQSLISGLIEKKDCYRKLYYIERVFRIIELHSINIKVLDAIFSWIKAFNNYESYLEKETAQV